jgi:hypothetical protein
LATPSLDGGLLLFSLVSFTLRSSSAIRACKSEMIASTSRH